MSSSCLIDLTFKICAFKHSRKARICSGNFEVRIFSSELGWLFQVARIPFKFKGGGLDKFMGVWFSFGGTDSKFEEAWFSFGGTESVFGGA